MLLNLMLSMESNPDKLRLRSEMAKSKSYMNSVVGKISRKVQLW